MTIAIHQPNFIPWIGYFYKMAKADLFVILDDVQHSKKSYTNRANIKTPNGIKRLTVPLSKKEILIKDIPISNDKKWNKQHLKIIHDSYSKAPFFDDYYLDIENFFLKQWEYLANFNIANILYLKEKMNIKTDLIRSSELQIDEVDKNMRNLAICKSCGADIYLSGDGGGRQYNMEEMFKQEGIDVYYTNFKHPEYIQLWGEFVPGLSVIDLLFNKGPESFNVLFDNN